VQRKSFASSKQNIPITGKVSLWKVENNALSRK
jgi:hypothetical protein